MPLKAFSISMKLVDSINLFSLTVFNLKSFDTGDDADDESLEDVSDCSV